MKALWFLPFAFAGGAEGFALFAPYLIGVLTLLYVVRMIRAALASQRESLGLRPTASAAGVPLDVLPAVQPA